MKKREEELIGAVTGLVRVNVQFSEDEYYALRRLAINEMRDARIQVRFLIRSALIALGYMSDDGLLTKMEAAEKPE